MISKFKVKDLHAQSHDCYYTFTIDYDVFYSSSKVRQFQISAP